MRIEPYLTHIRPSRERSRARPPAAPSRAPPGPLPTRRREVRVECIASRGSSTQAGVRHDTNGAHRSHRRGHRRPDCGPCAAPAGFRRARLRGGAGVARDRGRCRSRAQRDEGTSRGRSRGTGASDRLGAGVPHRPQLEERAHDHPQRSRRDRGALRCGGVLRAPGGHARRTGRADPRRRRVARRPLHGRADRSRRCLRTVSRRQRDRGRRRHRRRRIHSAVRASLFGEDAPRFTGKICYRGLVPVDAVPGWPPAPESATWLGPHGAVVV